MIGIKFIKMCSVGVYQEKSSGKDGGVAVPEKESALEEAGAMDAVLVNTHQVCFHSSVPLHYYSYLALAMEF